MDIIMVGNQQGKGIYPKADVCKAQLEVALHYMGVVGLQDQSPLDKTSPTVTAAERMTLTVLRALRGIQEGKELKMPTHGNPLTVQVI